MKKRRKYITLLIAIIMGCELCISDTIIENHTEEMANKYYVETLEMMVETYGIEDNTIIIDTNEQIAKINDDKIEINEKKEYKERNGLSSYEVTKEALNECGYEIVNENDGVVEAENIFASGRLYVNSNYVPNNYGAVMEASGEHTVLQYSNSKDAFIAYKKLKEDGYEILPSYTISLEKTDEYELLQKNTSYLDSGITYHGLNKMKEDILFQQRNVKVAIIDSGINDYYGRNIVPYNLTSSEADSDIFGHGSMVYSVIANSTSDNVDFISIKAFDDNGNADFATMEAAVLKCQELDVDVVNMSIGMYDTNFETKYGTMNIWNDIFSEMTNNGTVICVAAGNQGVNTDYVYPAGSPYTWAITSIDTKGNVAKTSNYGNVDFSAKGVNVVVTNKDGEISSTSGTSFASPYIASMAANYKGERDYSVDEIYQKIIENSLDLGEKGKDEVYGYGVPCYEYIKDEFEYCYHQDTEVITVESTCINEGKTYKICNDCGEVLYETNIKEPLGHRYSISVTKATCQTKGENIYTCDVCGYSYKEKINYDFENHINTEEKIITEPTCHKKGSAQKYCNACNTFIGYAYDIDKIEHKWITTDTVEGDCVEKGYINQCCEICEEKRTQETENGIVHNYDYLEERIIKKAACNENGETEVWCNHCNLLVETKKIDKTEHNFEITLIKGTCSEKGYNIHKCKDCGYSYVEYTDYEKDIHQLKTEIKEPTCTSYGYKKMYCLDCDYEKNEVIEKCKHNIVTIVTKDVMKEFCENCGMILNETKVKPDVVNGEENLKKYTLTIDANGGTYSAHIDNIEQNMNVILPNTQRAGYILEGWYIDDVKVDSTFPYSYDENKTVIAKWIKVELNKPKVIKATKSSLTVEPVEGAVGYQVYISSNTKFKPRNSYSSTKTTINVSEMARKGTYIAIRTVGKDSTGKYVYSAWKYYKY